MPHDYDEDEDRRPRRHAPRRYAADGDESGGSSIAFGFGIAFMVIGAVIVFFNWIIPITPDSSDRLLSILGGMSFFGPGLACIILSKK